MPDPHSSVTALPASAYALERQVALAAVITAAHLCEQVRRAQRSVAVAKPDASPVTLADYGSQALICRALALAFPADAIVAEEDARLLASQSGLLAQVTDAVAAILAHGKPDLRTEGITPADVLDWISRGQGSLGDRFWTLDPIDGTQGYVRGDQYAIALALIERGQVQLGVIACPALPLGAIAADPTGDPAREPPGDPGTLFVAVRGQGAQMLSLDQRQARTLRVNGEEQRPRFRLMQSVVGNHGTPTAQMAAAQAVGICTEPVYMDSLAKYGAIARGDGDLYLRLPSATSSHQYENIWDHAAGALVLEEAGGRVSDRHGKPLDFCSGIKMRSNVGIVASNGILHEAVLAALLQAPLAPPLASPGDL